MNKLNSSVNAKLTTIMEVIGTNTKRFSSSMRISPGNLPNQENRKGKKFRIKPRANVSVHSPRLAGEGLGVRVSATRRFCKPSP
jgi:hypothetical protein